MRVTSVFAIAVVMAVSAVAVPHAGFAQTCQRTVSIVAQVSAREGAGKLTFAVHSGGCAAAGEVGYEVVAGTASPGADFVLSGGRLRWAAGDNAVMAISATIVQDSKPEADLEDFTVSLVDPGPDTRIVQPDAQGRILDDDGPAPHGSVDDELCPDLLASQWCVCLAKVMPWRPSCVVNEFHLSAPQSSPLTLRWSTLDGTAQAGVDYVAVVDQSQTLAAGETTAALPVRVLTRPPGATSRFFHVRVSAVSGGVVVVDAVAMFTIGGS